MKPTKFRIIPVKPDLFHVEEKRRFWFGWKKCGEEVCGYGAHSYLQPHKFLTQDEAKTWIADEIDRRVAEAKHMATPTIFVHVDP